MERAIAFTLPLPQFMAIARNLAPNLDRDALFKYMAKRERENVSTISIAFWTFLE